MITTSIFIVTWIFSCLLSTTISTDESVQTFARFLLPHILIKSHIQIQAIEQFDDLNEIDLYESARRLLRYFEGYDDIDDEEAYAQYDNDEIHYDKLIEMMEWIETEREKLSEEETLYDDDDYYDMIKNKYVKLKDVSLSNRREAKEYDIILIRHPHSNGNKYKWSNIAHSDVAPSIPEGFEQIRDFSERFMTELTSAKPSIAAKLKQGKYFLHMSPLTRAQSVGLSAMQSIINSAKAEAAEGADFDPTTAYPKSIYITRNLQEHSGGAASNAMKRKEPFFKFATAYFAEKWEHHDDHAENEDEDESAINAIMKKFEAWKEEKFTSHEIHHQKATLDRWKLDKGMDAYEYEYRHWNVHFHSKLRDPVQNKKHGWRNKGHNAMKKWAWNLRRADAKRDEPLSRKKQLETDDTVPTDEVVVVGGHSSVIKEFLTDKSIDWSNVVKRGNPYKRLINDKLTSIATQKGGFFGKYWELKDTAPEMPADGRAISDLKQDKLLNCQAVYLKMQVSGSYKKPKIKIKEFKEVFEPHQNLWT